MKKIVITEFMDDACVEDLKQRFDVVYDPTLVDGPERMLHAVADADAVIVRNRTQVRGDLLAAMGRATVVGRLGVGLDNIDVPACEARGMRVIPATGANALAVAEYVVCTAMVLLRGAYGCTPEVTQGRWPRTALSNGREIAGKTLGLIGFGGIGVLTARLAKGLGMQVVAYDPMVAPDAPIWQQTGVTPLALDALLAQADVVSLHIPLTDATRGLLSAERIAQMKPTAILINTARGYITDEAAVAQALRDGHLGGAAYDVFDTEPVKADSHWVNCPNLILTPHIAGLTAESNDRVSSMIAAEVAKALS
jgi:(S)-sulfolactate dehydrogenase